MSTSTAIRKTMFGGYKKQDVDSLLESITTEQFELQKKNKDLMDRCSQLETDLQNYRNMEDTLKRALMVAEEAATDLQKIVEQEAQQIIDDAAVNADRIVEEALVQAKDALTAIERMKKDVDVFKQRLKLLLEAQLELTDDDVWREVVSSLDGYESPDVLEPAPQENTSDFSIGAFDDFLNQQQTGGQTEPELPPLILDDEQ
ncbi:DivIVA domain-containing protein [Culicoidibacter larvae]|uniref:DivIVA domain-containing protein n=1 Tax=Culicoidibacter larvae TaxID=2579976 RepID=A0A5R8QGM4_9FIRM|nr:DivIVA domain-containing protein [Culicoidibacter larvae]TLG76613.1 DivIVA domain-containing protein [Culicoidibacter larvae]